MIDNPTMLDVVRALSDAYSSDGVAIVLATTHETFSLEAPLINYCRTVQGRREVYAWADSLSGMTAT